MKVALGDTKSHAADTEDDDKDGRSSHSITVIQRSSIVFMVIFGDLILSEKATNDRHPLHRDQ